MKFTATTTVMTPDGCWRVVKNLGPGDPPVLSPGSKGYVLLQRGGRSVKAHRAIYARWIGKIPDGMQLDHLCRNPSCVNPAHLEPVTSKENTRRSPFFNGRKTYCPKGHPYSGSNLRFGRKKNGSAQRVCAACSRVAVKKCMDRIRGKANA